MSNLKCVTVGLIRPLMCGFLVGVMLLGTTGCATILTGGGERPVMIDTRPQGADVTVNGQSYGQTPIKVLLDRDEFHLVRITKAGYEPFEAQVSPGFNGWVIGNILIGGLIGLVVDFASGAWQTLYPDGIRLQMLPTGSQYPPTKKAIKSIKSGSSSDTVDAAIGIEPPAPAPAPAPKPVPQKSGNPNFR